MDRPASTVHQIGDAEVDFANNCVRREGDEVVLRLKSFRVLRYLVENPRVVTKDELIAHVWDGAAVTDDVIVRCVAEIRKALGRDAHLLKTLPKIGYRLIAAAPPPPAGRSRLRLALGLAALAALASTSFLPWRPGGAALRNEAAWWRLDETSGSTAADSSPGGHAGRLTGAAIWELGRLGGGLRLDGVTSHIHGAPVRLLPQPGSPSTLAAWIRASSPNGDRTAAFHHGVALGLDEQGRAAFWNEPYGGRAVGQRPLTDNRWHLLAAVYEGPPSNRARIFVDGEEEGADRFNWTPASFVPWTIGRFSTGGTPFRGAVDDVRVYAHALSTSEVQALYRCTSSDGQPYYLPVFSPNARLQTAVVSHPATDFAGIQVAHAVNGCPASSWRGANLGQDLRLESDLRVPLSSDGHRVLAGPYFRTRAAYPGDGIIGGVSAGYWVQLDSAGAVRVKRLYPQAVVAFSAPRAGFDSHSFHHLVATAKGSSLQVTLDGQPVEFDQAGRLRPEVEIQAAWEKADPPGHNDGAAGVAFASEYARGLAGGQQMRNLVVTPLVK